MVRNPTTRLVDAGAVPECGRPEDLARAFAQLTDVTQRTGSIPLLHIEAHASEEGVEGPDGPDCIAQIPWEVLTSPLGDLNAATQCNLVVFVATCLGYALVKALIEGPIAPVVAIVGPAAPVQPSDLLQSSKEFYRRLGDPDSELHSMAASASREATNVEFVVEPFAVLAYDAMCKVLIAALRERKLDRASIASRYQRAWDELFMVDVTPESRRRFGIDVGALVEEIDAALRPKRSPVAPSSNL